MEEKNRNQGTVHIVVYTTATRAIVVTVTLLAAVTMQEIRVLRYPISHLMHRLMFAGWPGFTVYLDGGDGKGNNNGQIDEFTIHTSVLINESTTYYIVQQWMHLDALSH